LDVADGWEFERISLRDVTAVVPVVLVPPPPPVTSEIAIAPTVAKVLPEVHVGPDPPRITFIAVQHTVRYAGTIEHFKHTQQDPSGTVALLNVPRSRC